MQFRQKKGKQKGLTLDITPLIDVIFLLLIFFMISTTFISAPGIHVDLPVASSKPKTQKQQSLEVIITDRSQLFLGGRTIKKKQLKSALAYAKKKLKKDTLVIKADGKVQHQLVVFVMDAARQTGIQKLSIATKIKPKK